MAFQYGEPMRIDTLFKLLYPEDNERRLQKRMRRVKNLGLYKDHKWLVRVPNKELPHHGHGIILYDGARDLATNIYEMRQELFPLPEEAAKYKKYCWDKEQRKIKNMQAVLEHYHTIKKLNTYSTEDLVFMMRVEVNPLLCKALNESVANGFVTSKSLEVPFVNRDIHSIDNP